MTAPPVPLLDLRRDTSLDAELEAAFRRVLRSGHYILGPEVDAFERACASYIGAKHAIGVSSGTDALLLAMMALGVGAGDEVICPTFTFYATAGCVWRLGARPVFVDSDLETFNALPGEIAARITPKTRCIMPVHLFGQCADMEPILDAANRRGVPVIEDAAQALGARHARHSAGVMGAVGCFSFFPSKNLGGYGDAGLVTTNDDALAERMRVLRVHGGKPKYHHGAVGGNFRIDALQAALLAVKLPRLDGYTAARQRNAAQYVDELVASGLAHRPPALSSRTSTNEASRPESDAARADGTARLILPRVATERHIYNQFTVRVIGAGARDELQAHLKQHGIGSEVYYPIPMHQQACFASLGHRAGDFPNAERLCSESLSLPIFPELTADEIHRVVAAIVDFFAGRR